MKHKKYLFLLILLFPAVLKLFLEFTTVNSSKLPYFGEKIANGKDTIYQTTNDVFYTLPSSNSNIQGLQPLKLDTIQYPLFALCFIKESYKKDNFRLAGLSEYLQYNKNKTKEIPFIIATACDGLSGGKCFNEFEKLSTDNQNVKNVYWNPASFDSINYSYFKNKSYYIEPSFFVLVDKQRHIRGYYDGRYVGELKRLIEEYQHLRLKEEKKSLLETNKIESK